MPFCHTCHAFIFQDEQAKHHCPPKWRARFADYGPAEDRTVRAHSAEQAAINYVQSYDEWKSNGITDDALVLVTPADDPDAEPKCFRVQGESRPEYSADEISAAEIPGDTLVEEIPTEEPQPCSDS